MGHFLMAGFACAMLGICSRVFMTSGTVTASIDSLCVFYASVCFRLAGGLEGNSVRNDNSIIILKIYRALQLQELNINMN